MSEPIQMNLELVPKEEVEDDEDVGTPILDLREVHLIAPDAPTTTIDHSQVGLFQDQLYVLKVEEMPSVLQQVKTTEGDANAHLAQHQPQEVIIKTQVKENGDKRFLCNFCTKDFKQSHHLRRHILTHTGEKPYCCEVCSKTFTRKDKLQGHLATHSTTMTNPDKPRSCDQCKVDLGPGGEDFETHMKTHHGGATPAPVPDKKPHVCEFCERRFATKASLQVHFFQTHVGKKSLVCHYCNWSFSDRKSLQEHLRTHIVAKPRKCEGGSGESGGSAKSTIQADLLKTHMTKLGGAEKPFSCNLCQRCFKQSYHLKRHLLTHTGEKPYQCEVCEKTFTRKEILQKHQATHGEVECSKA